MTKARMKLTAALFCTWMLFRTTRCSVQRLVNEAVKLDVDLQDYDIRRALRELMHRKLVECERSKRSAKLLYALTAKGRNDVRKDRKVLRSIHGTLELKGVTKPKKPSKEPELRYEMRETPAEDNAGMD